MIIPVSEYDAYEVFLQHVQFEITGICNLRCIHCRAWNEPKQHLPIDVIREVLKFASLSSDEGFGVTISGGEPFVRLDLPFIVEQVVASKAILAAITTNGLLCTKKRLNEVLKASGGFEMIIQVSVDSANPEEHDAFRGKKGSFSAAVRALKNAQDIGLATAVRATIKNVHLNSMEPIAELIASLGVRYLSFGSIVPFGRAVDNSMGMLSLEKKAFLTEVTRIKKQFSSHLRIETEDPLKACLGCDDVWGISDIDPNDELSFGGCTAGITTLNVNSRGDITPCAVIPKVILNASGKNASLIEEEYVNSPIVQQLLSRSYNGKCGTCSSKRVCGGCRAIPYALTGDLMGTDPTCWV